MDPKVSPEERKQAMEIMEPIIKGLVQMYGASKSSGMNYSYKDKKFTLMFGGIDNDLPHEGLKFFRFDMQELNEDEIREHLEGMRETGKDMKDLITGTDAEDAVFKLKHS